MIFVEFIILVNMNSPAFNPDMPISINSLQEKQSISIRIEAGILKNGSCAFGDVAADRGQIVGKGEKNSRCYIYDVFW